jgi:membrane protein
MRGIPPYLSLLKQAAAAWSNDRAASMGAALAFYSAFSLAPLLIIVIAVAGMIFGVDAARGAVSAQLGTLLGPVGADALQKLLMAASNEGSGVVATVIGVAVLLVGATTVLVELQDDLDRIWEAPPRKESGLKSMLRARLISFGLILGIGFLLVVSLVVGSTLAALAHHWRISVSNARALFALDFALTIVVFTVLFAILFKWLPYVKIAWRDVWAGALLTAVLFNVGRLAIGWYLGSGATASTYAAAGSFVVLLLWLYYSAQIFLFGAEFTWVHAKHRTRPQPSLPATAKTQSADVADRPHAPPL